VPGEIRFPWGSPSAPGDFGMAAQTAAVLPRDRFTLRFQESDDFSGPTAGYHFKQVLVDGRVVWEKDVAGGPAGWQQIVVDVTEQVRGKSQVTVAFRILDRQGVANFGLHWHLKGLRTDGLQLAADLKQPERWQVESKGPFEVGFGDALKKGEGRFHIPFIVMTAAQPAEFRGRHGDPATPERMGKWLRMSLQAWKEGRCDGVVTYCLDKSPKSTFFPLAARLFGGIKR